MKKYLLLLTLLLASCIPVDDMSLYWDKGTLDTRFFGRWLLAGKAEGGLVVAKARDMYEIDSADDSERSKSGYTPIFARVLLTHDGNGFLLIADDVVHARSGNIIRYKFDGDDTLNIYTLKAPALRALLKEKYRHAFHNIRVNDNAKAGADVAITTLDDATFAVLSEIPDNGTYWTRVRRYKKVLQ